MKSMSMLLNRFKDQEHERLGQFFCNRFVAQAWPELYYEEDETKAAKMIESWLASHHYTESLPNDGNFVNPHEHKLTPHL